MVCLQLLKQKPSMKDICNSRIARSVGWLTPKVGGFRVIFRTRIFLVCLRKFAKN